MTNNRLTLKLHSKRMSQLLVATVQKEQAWGQYDVHISKAFLWCLVVTGKLTSSTPTKGSFDVEHLGSKKHVHSMSNKQAKLAIAPSRPKQSAPTAAETRYHP